MIRRSREHTAIQSRRRRVAELFLQGTRSQFELGRQLQVHRSTISRDLRAIRTQWAEASIDDYSAAVAEELARITLLEQEAWRAWDRSKARGSAGNPHFLRTVAWCIDCRAKLLGLYPRRKDPHTGPIDGGISLVDIVRQVEEGRSVEVIDTNWINARIQQPAAGNGEARLPQS